MDKLFLIESFDDFKHVIHKVISNLMYSTPTKDDDMSTEIDLSDLIQAADDVRKIISDCDFELPKIEETMAGKNWNEEKTKYFVNLLKKNKSEIIYASLHRHNSEYGETITHSDWVLKLVLGTSELNTTKYPLLQLILSTIDSNGVQNQKIYEIKKDMIHKSIQTLETFIQESG